MKLERLLENGYQKNNDLNCAEAILQGANECYALGLDDKALKLAAGFGGGLGIEETCGVVTGMAMVLSVRYAQERGHTSPEMKHKIQMAIAHYENRHHSILCRCLKATCRDKQSGCHRLIVSGGNILDEIIQEK